MSPASTASRATRFVSALTLMVAIVVGVPVLLVVAARTRFGGPWPWSGIQAPNEWAWGATRRALTGRLSEETIADVVIRTCLAGAWIAVVVLAVTVVTEVLHMVRHGGLPRPDVRGLGAPQSLARAIAAGLLVVLPILSSPARAIARDGHSLAVERPAVSAMVVAGPPEHRVGAPVETPAPEGEPGPSQYVVRAGDSVFAIAERRVGSDPAAITAYADQVLDLNLGRQMPDGRHFTNAAFLDVGWELELPPVPPPTSVVVDPGTGDRHWVEPGETLWSIAADELGDPRRWPEIYESNHGRTFDDGRTFDEPGLIQPGWDLAIPGEALDLPPPVAEVDVSRVDEPTPDEEARADEEAQSQDEPVATVEPPVPEIAPDEVLDPARPSNRWIDGRPGAFAELSTDVDPAPTRTDDDTGAGIQLLTLGRAAMLSGGALTLLAVRRRRQLRQARPRAVPVEPPAELVSMERSLRAIDSTDRFLRVDLAIRAAATPLIDADRRVIAVTVGTDGSVILHASGGVELGGPWTPTTDPTRWELAGSVPIELLAEPARRVGAPCPTLVQLGRTIDERDLYVDLEALAALEIGGLGHQADSIVAAIAATLAGSVLAEVTTLVGVGVGDAAFLGHRHHLACRDAPSAFARAADVVGSTAEADRSTFELRSRATGGETWEPAVVLIGSAAGTVTPPTNRTGLAVVSASPIHGPSSRLAPDGDAWELRPLGVRLTPVGLDPRELASVAALVRAADDELVDDDPTLAPIPDEPSASTPPVLVRLLGPVSIRSADDREAEFDKSKAKELIAWLATHRERSTRSGARTAMWELDVRDATFANVVSEARRSLARLVEPPEGEEWIGRTLTEALPLHGLVRTDADLVREALDAARLQPPDQAIATLRPAVDLVVGMPFEGTGYLWPEAEGIASRLVLLATSATAELAAHCLSVADIDGVFDATARGLQVLPGHEELIGLRMRAHAVAGDHAGVRHEWEQYERVINADPWSDGELSPVLTELRRELLTR